MPLSELGGLISQARKKEEQAFKADLEKRLFPLWLANYALYSLKGGGEFISYEDFINNTLNDSESLSAPSSPSPTVKNGDDIIVEFMPFIEAERRRQSN